MCVISPFECLVQDSLSAAAIRIRIEAFHFRSSVLVAARLSSDLTAEWRLIAYTVPDNVHVAKLSNSTKKLSPYRYSQLSAQYNG